MLGRLITKFTIEEMGFQTVKFSVGIVIVKPYNILARNKFAESASVKLNYAL